MPECVNVSPNPHVDKVRQTIDTRAAELGKSLRQVARDAGITEEQIRAIRAGEVSRPRTRTLHGLDRALAWKPGSASDLFDGGKTIPLDAPADAKQHAVDNSVDRIMAMSNLTDDEKATYVAMIRESSRTIHEQAKRLNNERKRSA
jgi:DNA-binding Xre family transcriptional regulator